MTDANSHRAERAVSPIWPLVVSVLALVISSVNLIYTHQTASRQLAPNVRMIDASGYRSVDAGSEGAPDRVSLCCHARLKNWGDAPTQIIQVAVEPLQTASIDQSSFLLIASDDEDALTDHFDRFKRFKLNPVLGIKDATLQSGAIRDFYIRFDGEVDLQQGREIPNIRILITLSSGDTITILPKLLSTGVSMQVPEGK